MKPTPAEIAVAGDKRVPDIVAPGLTVLFCGINPGLYSAAVGAHFGRPGNRFWKTLHLAGFTPWQFDPLEQGKLLDLGYGIVNVVDRASTGEADLNKAEIRAGGVRLQEKISRLQPKYLAVLGVGAYRIAFSQPKAQIGAQVELIGTTRVWVLPNPSGLNANYNQAQLTLLFQQFRFASQRV